MSVIGASMIRICTAARADKAPASDEKTDSPPLSDQRIGPEAPASGDDAKILIH